MNKKIGAVPPQLYKYSLGFAPLTCAVVMIVSPGAIAASNQAAFSAVVSQQPTRIAQSTSTNKRPDVLIDGSQNSADPSTTSPSASSGKNGTNLSKVRFTCESVNGQYTVMYHPQSQPSQSFAWATPSAMGSSWSPERRCNEISRRLESYRPDGLVEMRTDKENGYNTICVTTEAVQTCRIVLTVPPGQDPMSTRDRVFQNLTVADSGQATQAVNTFVGGRGNGTLNQVLNNLGLSSILSGSNSQSKTQNIYLKPFLDQADGGTGTQLKGGVSQLSNPRLNPGNFR